MSDTESGSVHHPENDKSGTVRAAQQGDWFSAILATALDCIIAMDHQGKIVEFNAAAERTFGRLRAEVVGQPLAELIIPERFRLAHYRGLAHNLATGEGPILGQRIEMSALRADGREFPIELAITRIPTEDPPLFLAYARDITERNKAEQRRAAQLAVTQALAQSSTLEQAIPLILRAVCEHLGWDLGAFWILDPHKDMLRCLEVWHPEAAEVAEFEEACRKQTFPPELGLPGRIWTSGQPAWIRDVVEDPNFPRAAAAVRSGLHGAFGYPVLLGSEVLGVLEFISREVREPDAELLEMVASLGSQFGQFMERRRTEQGLRRTEGRLRFLADASAALAGLLDYESAQRRVAALGIPYLADCCLLDLLANDGRVRRVSAAMLQPERENSAPDQELEYTIAADSPSPVAQVLREGRSVLLNEIDEALLNALAVGPSDRKLLQFVRPRSGVCLPLALHDRLLGVLVLLSSGRRYEHADLGLAEEFARSAAVALDNSRLYQETKDAERRKDLFLAQLAHELRGPLAPLNNALHILTQLGSGSDAVQQVRAMMGRQIEQLTILIDDLLDLSRIGQGKIQLRKEEVELSTLIRRAVEIARPLIQSRHHELTVALPQTALRLEVDPARQVQVLANLLTNAAKYTEDGGRIWLTAAVEEGDVVLRVRDNGTGIPKEMLPRVFELFTQLDRPLERALGGLGIGLSLVKNLVQMHGGTVEAHSDGPGRGSEFTVRLPAHIKQLAERRSLKPGKPAARGPALRVLICDDNRDAVDSLAMLLGMWGHEVHKSHDGPTAIRAAGDCQPDAVLLDIGLPGGMNGYEVARRLRHGGSTAYLVALTGFGGQEERRLSQEAGFNHHLIKPVDLTDLQTLLNGLAPGNERVHNGSVASFA